MKSLGDILNNMLGESTSLVPGQMVVCINDHFDLCRNAAGDVIEPTVPHPRLDDIYIIRHVDPFRGQMYVSLMEREPTSFYHAAHFRPVRPTSIEVFRDLLAPVDGAGSLQSDRVS